MTETLKVVIGGSLQEDLAAFRSAWERAERGEAVAPEWVLSFVSLEGLAAALNGLNRTHQT
jgi:hypothetical protein